MVTAVPRPRSLVTAMVPPFSSTLRFAIAIPSPVPVIRVEKYGSKMRASTSGSSPTPVSRMTSCTCEACRRGADREGALVGHCVERILDDVRYRPLHQYRVEAQRGQTRRQVRRQGDAAFEAGSIGSQDLAHESREIRRRAPGDRRGRVARELGGDLPQYPDLFQDRFDATLQHRGQRRSAVGMHAKQMLGAELDRGQGILDLVGDLPRHLRPRFQTMRALELVSLCVELDRHPVEVRLEDDELVGGPRRDLFLDAVRLVVGYEGTELAPRDAAGCPGEPLDGIGDAPGDDPADEPDDGGEEQGGPQHTAVELVDLALYLLLPRS